MTFCCKSEERFLSAQPNNLTGSEVGRKNWAAPFGMTVGWSVCSGDRESQNRYSYSRAKAKRGPRSTALRVGSPLREPIIQREVGLPWTW